MSKIKIFGLGGLSESGKNSYVIEVDDEIFVFDAGIKFASGNLLGIDYIMPDFSYLVKNKKRIKGLFITHGHPENMGAVRDLLKDIPTLKVYATKYTKFELMEDGVNENNIVLIKPHKKINFGSVSIFPIAVSHSCPDSVMYVVNTKDGAICYTGDFIIDPSMQGAYDMDIGKIAYIGKQGVLCLLCESSFAEKNGHTSPKHRLVNFFGDVIKHHDKRIIFSVLPTHLYTISEIFEAAANSHRKIILMGKRLQNVVSFAHKEGYMSYNEEILGDLSNINDENAILLVMDDRTTPYANMNKILKRNTTDEENPRYNVGGFKIIPNKIGLINVIDTSAPEDVEKDIGNLLLEYKKIKNVTIEDIIDFHYKFELIHPFGDGNGRVGRMIMFRECLRNNIMPFIVLDNDKSFYMRGLKNYKNDKLFLIDTIKHEQDLYEDIVNEMLDFYLNGK